MTNLIFIFFIIVALIVNAVYIQSPLFIILIIPMLVRFVLLRWYGKLAIGGETKELTDDEKAFLKKNQGKIAIVNIFSWIFSLTLIFGTFFFIYHITYPDFYSLLPQLLVESDWSEIKIAVLLLIMLFYWSFAFVYLIQLILLRSKAQLLLKYDVLQGKVIKVTSINFFNNRMALIMLIVTILIFLI